MSITQPLKWHGGKSYLANRIIDLMPSHKHYVEPFFGGGAVLLNKDCEGISEVANDIHLELTNFWKSLREPDLFAEMRNRLEMTPFSAEEWREAESTSSDPVERACRFFIRCRQSRAGKFDSFATVTRNRTRRGMNEQVSAWLGAVEGLPDVAERMRRVLILNDDAMKVIEQQDGKNTLFYLDPPYLHQTRVTTTDYENEMSIEDHSRLLDVINGCDGKVMLSGYHSALYADRLSEWNRVEFQIDNKASSAKTKPKKTEVVWMNF